MKEKQRKSRTILQNKSLHKYCDQLAIALNDAGLDAKTVLEPEDEIPWSREMIKELLVRPILVAMTGKRSTTEATTVEITEIYAVLDRHLSSKFGVHVDWPCEETLAERQRKVFD